MEQQFCHSLKDSLLAYLASEIEVDTLGDKCVITLPMTTLDHNFISVYVESRVNDFFLVHEGGKTIADLYAQGIHMTDTKALSLTAMAKRFGASFSNGIFQAGCKADTLQDAIMAIGQCASLASIEVLQVKPVVEEESIQSRVSRSLHQWKPTYVTEIEPSVLVKGQQTQHTFNFVSFTSSPHKTVAVKIITPTYGASVGAERYGYQVSDIHGTYADQWKRLAVITKVEEWNERALKIVESNSAETLQLRQEDERDVDTLLPEVMDRLAS